MCNKKYGNYEFLTKRPDWPWGSCLEVKWPRYGIDHPPPSSTNIQAKLLTSTYRTCACPWHISKGCQRSDQGLDKLETWGVLPVHLW